MTVDAAPHALREPRRCLDLRLRSVSNLDDIALLATFLSGGAQPRADLAGRLIDRFGDFAAVFGADASELRRCGADTRQIGRLACLREAAVRLAREAASRQPVISSWTQLLAYVRTTIAHLPREQFRALYLDKKNRLLQAETVADGAVDHAPVYPRELVRRALELSASAMILVHNHPSGDPTPSAADIEMTRKVIDAARLFDILVHDHIVVAREGVASFKSLGLI